MKECDVFRKDSGKDRNKYILINKCTLNRSPCFKTMFFIQVSVVLKPEQPENTSALITNEEVIISYCVFNQATYDEKRKIGSGGIRTHASEETGALNQRLRPLGHATRCGDPGNSNRFTFH